MKKFGSVVSIVLLIIFIIYSIHIIYPGYRRIDLLDAEVISIKTDDAERCLYVITSHTYTGTDNIICEIKIPYRTRCKTYTGDKISVQDIKIGDRISLNFKGESEYIDGVNYAVAKGIIEVR